MIDIVLVWLSIVATIALFWPVHLLAALLLVPYLVWVTFAVALNVSIWRLNREG
jgi:tryptophan-rich sensory protein